MLVAITGSAGMLGQDLCAKLKKRSVDFCGIDIKEPVKQQLEPDEYHQASVTDRAEITSLIASLKPEIVIHAAAYTAVDKCEEEKKLAYNVNAEGAKNVALGCKGSGSLMIYISTDYVFDGLKKIPYSQNDKPNPLSTYGKSKYKGELNVQEVLEDNFLIVRTSWLYGKNGPNFVDKIIEKAEAEGKLKVVDDQVGSPTYTVDFSAALCELVFIYQQGGLRQQAEKGPYHVSNAGSCSWYEYAGRILELAGVEAEVEKAATSDINLPAARPAYSVLDNKRFRNLISSYNLDFSMRPWQEALADYIKNK